MAGKIPKQFIEDLLARVDIIQVIDQRVPLRKAGHEYKACCPFHAEKTPSFTVSPSKQFFHCFGCGAHGTALGFVMDFDRLDFLEAVGELAESVGLEVPREAGIERSPNLLPVYDMLNRAAQFYAWQLRSHPEAKRAVEYLRQRGLSGAIAAEFRIGFAPPGWDNLLREFGRDGPNRALIRDAGLISEPDSGKAYDRFRDRIMFPIHDSRGRVVGFGGRVLGQGTPKYLNSPETPVFHKGRELYGLYEAKQANKRLHQVLVVEGYMDVVALAQFDVRSAVATLGTATTADHLEKLYRTAAEVIFCFDGDRAGRDAARKALETTLPLLRDGRQARFLFLPDGEDPDSLIRQEGRERFEARFGDSLPLSEFLFQELSEGVDMSSLDGRARFDALARPLINKVPAGIYRGLLNDRLAELVKARPHRLHGDRMPHPAEPRLRRRTGRPRTLMQQIIAKILQQPEIVQHIEVPAAMEAIQVAGSAQLRGLLETLRRSPHLPTSALVEGADASARESFRQLAVAALDDEVEFDRPRQLQDALNRLIQRAYKEEFSALTKRPLDDLSDAEKQRLRELSRGRQALCDKTL